MAETTEPTPSTKKQAVVVIHGMGEQRPMHTIREFVINVWKRDPKLHEPHFWNKPSSVSDSFEQRRLTTDTPKVKESDVTTQRTDFFEYYWAHQTVGTKWEHFTGWFTSLLLCPPSRYAQHPTTLYQLWFVLWALILFGVGLILLSDCLPGWLVGAATFIWGVFVVFARQFFTQYFGDVARYVQAKPANINIRQSIRSGGINLLERIHQTGDYDRIVLVGHSLGSIVAYDILTHLWARHNKFKSSTDKPTPLSKDSKSCSEPSIPLIDRLSELALKNGEDDFEQENYWALQRKLFESLKKDDPNNNWLISDFITLGSPLTYADVLLFTDSENFAKRKLDRELPTSPPLTEQGKWYYGDNDKFLHHGAVFAPVKWTNIYMPHEHFYKGDFISGSVSKNFSYTAFNNEAGTIASPTNINKTTIEEISLDYKAVKKGFTHTEYWKQSELFNAKNEHLTMLRKALNLYVQ